MELKNALTICLISLFSATLVMLIARSLDSQAASRLEPQLARIAEELEAIRSSGGLVASSGAQADSQSLSEGLLVYYFHGNTRCPTCRSIESQSHETVEGEFSEEMKSGELAWKMLNYEESSGTELATQFEIQVPVVVLAQMQNGEIKDWKRLDQVWALVGDKPAFAQYVRTEIRGMLDASKPDPELAEPSDATSAGSTTDSETDDLPLPTGPELLPN